MSDTYIPSRVMAITAHPDDIEFGAAGTIAKWVQAGAEAAYVLCTSGDVGIADLSLSKEEVIAIRERETREAAAIVGVHDVTFLRQPDGMLENTLALRKKLVREIRRFKPEVIVTLDPTLVWTGYGGLNHPDHRAAGAAAVDATFPASGQPHLFQELEAEGLQAHKVFKVYASRHGEGSELVDISPTIELKVKALQAHDSQVSHMDVDERLRLYGSMIGEAAGLEYAESFVVATLISEEEWQKQVARYATPED